MKANIRRVFAQRWAAAQAKGACIALGGGTA